MASTPRATLRWHPSPRAGRRQWGAAIGKPAGALESGGLRRPPRDL